MGDVSRAIWALPAWLGLLLALGGGLGSIALAPEPIPRGDLDQRLANWQREVDAGAPIGAVESDVARWKHGFFAEEPYGFTLSAFGKFEENFAVENLQTRRPRDGCRIWQISLSINYDTAGKVEERRAEAYPICPHVVAAPVQSYTVDGPRFPPKPPSSPPSPPSPSPTAR